MQRLYIKSTMLSSTKQHTLSLLLIAILLLLSVTTNCSRDNQANSTSLKQVHNIKTNITSSLSVSPEFLHFATITRQLSRTSSQWIYRLQLYEFNSKKKLDSIDIYQTYNTDKHFLTFIPQASQGSLIAMCTVQNLIFYRSDPLRKVAEFRHEQPKVYDVQASPDGQLVVIVGQQIVMYRINGFRRIVFPQVIPNARFCDFSEDGRYMTIATTNSLWIYTYQRNNDNYDFQQIPLESTAPVQYEAITSIQFNPTNSSQILVGFLSASPMVYSMVLQRPTVESPGGYFKKIHDIQPMSSSNAKIARWMPDGSRFYSYDFLNGIGLWPGASSKLTYMQKFLLYDATSNQDGTRLIGFVWQSIKFVDIQNRCTDKQQTVGLTCPCGDGQSWNYASYKCQNLNCLQSQYATGVIRGGACQCIFGYRFDIIARKCRIDCKSIQHAVSSLSNLYQCNCVDNWSWNPLTRTCDFQCDKVPYSTGVLTNNGQCGCLSGFVWNSTYRQCICPSYMKPQSGACLCIGNYFFDASVGKCLPNCPQINGIPDNIDMQRCICGQGYYFSIKSDIAGCQINCSAINDTIQQTSTFDTCLCHQNMDWLDKTCVPNCGIIQYSDPVPLGNNTCNCAINYIWINKIKECARDCSNEMYVIPDMDSTLISCPCIKGFEWSQSQTQCRIQCTIIANSQPYNLKQINRCQCRPGFTWNLQNYTCKVNCQQIWNAQSRLNDSHCNCKQGQPFNPQTLICTSPESSGLFSSTLSIIGFVVGIIVVVIILIILLRFCWSFATQKDKTQQKKLKINSPEKKRDRLVRREKRLRDENLDEPIVTDQRLRARGTKLTN